MLLKWEIIVSGMGLWMIMWDNWFAEVYEKGEMNLGSCIPDLVKPGKKYTV